MKVSICITVLNEEENVGRLMSSLSKQTRRPDEIVVVDGGSEDSTLEALGKFKEKFGNLKIISKKCSISEGRNISINRACGDTIALTDAGCIPKRNWLEKITEPFENKKVDLVAGFYEMPSKSHFQEAVNVYLGVPPNKFDPENFLPSARSVAFRKKVWKLVGGFDENLSGAGEDTKFFYEVVKGGFGVKRVKDAIVIWEEIGKLDIKSALKKFFYYSKGDAEAGIWWHPGQKFSSHNVKIMSIYLRYLMGLVFLFLSVLGDFPLFFGLMTLAYLFYPIWKFKDEVKDFYARLWLPIVQVASDIAVMLGFAAGTIRI